MIRVSAADGRTYEYAVGLRNTLRYCVLRAWLA